MGLSAVSDEPSGVGPLGGLIGLLAHAERSGASHALALACDLPRIGADLLQRLAGEATDKAAVVAVQGEIRNPLIARYAVAQALSAARDVPAPANDLYKPCSIAWVTASARCASLRRKRRPWTTGTRRTTCANNRLCSSP